MIDIHCHILPEMDDGPKNWDDTIEMCRIAVSDGIKEIVATPHITPGLYQNGPDEVRRMVGELRKRITELDLPLAAHPGADVRFTADLPQCVDNNRVPLLGAQGGVRRYLLCEFPAQMVPPNSQHVFFELQLRGITPIITHPERNAELQTDLDLLYKFICGGALAQVTADSLTGGFSPGVAIVARRMLALNLVHIIATDAHSPSHRKPCLHDGVTAAAAVIGAHRANEMVTVVPAAIVAGLPIEVPEPLEPRTQRRFVSALTSWFRE